MTRETFRDVCESNGFWLLGSWWLVIGHRCLRRAPAPFGEESGWTRPPERAAAEHTLFDVPPTRPAPPTDHDTLATARAVLGDRYTIEREIGRGGMATVYLAEEAKHGRPVAIKVLRPELAATLGAERFLREIGIAARLSHPHLVPLIDSGDAGGLLYYVSAYLSGGSLLDRIDSAGKLGVRDAL